MLFKVFPENALEILYDVLAPYPLVGPQAKGKDREDKDIFVFDYINSFAELRLDFPTTIHSVKKFLLPSRENLCTFNLFDGDWEKYVDFNIYKPHVFFGLHPCDINALNKLDKVLTGPVYPDPFYSSKRKNMFIIGVNCNPQSWCFCKSMGADTVYSGFDMFLTDLGDKYFVEILSATAYDILTQLPIADPSEADHRRFIELMDERNRNFVCQVDSSDLTKILDLEFQSPVWQEWGDRCMSCGSCASVCPTCYCYGVKEYVDLDLTTATKQRQLYSCNLIDFAMVAGGHNFRPDSPSRLKYRYYHKHRGFQEAYEEALCVGCGRCGQACLADITVPDVIDSVRRQKVPK
ncbi:MAG: 4Fe-4S dicluster domain-containing protein [Desulfocapsa sp.]|nr:4Fe-4S dicluster domain-containing protein [Desulfocapsa sp.]